MQKVRTVRERAVARAAGGERVGPHVGHERDVQLLEARVVHGVVVLHTALDWHQLERTR